jgi:hypothetical protein
MTFSKIIMTELLLSLLSVQASFASPQAKEVLLSDVVFTELLNVKDVPDSIMKKLSEIAEDQNLRVHRLRQKWALSSIQSLPIDGGALAGLILHTAYRSGPAHWDFQEWTLTSYPKSFQKNQKK